MSFRQWRCSSLCPDAASLKRKLAEIDEPVLDDDTVRLPPFHQSYLIADRAYMQSSQSSKRSRAHSSSHSSASVPPGPHACPACDAGFATPAALRAHGLRGGSEACCVAVEYALEQ